MNWIRTTYDELPRNIDNYNFLVLVRYHFGDKWNRGQSIHLATWERAGYDPKPCVGDLEFSFYPHITNTLGLYKEPKPIITHWMPLPQFPKGKE